MNTKAKGSRNERKTIRLLEAAGYACTKAASLGVFDIIAIGQADVVCVQVKSNAWPRSAEMMTLQAFPLPAERPQTGASLARSSARARCARG